MSESHKRHADRRTVSLNEQEILDIIEKANQELAKDERAVSFNPSRATSPSSVSTGSDKQTPLSPKSAQNQSKIRTWVDALASWEQFSRKKSKRLCDLVLQGIPKELRCMAWQKLAQLFASTSTAMPAFFATQQDVCNNIPDYAELLILESPHEKVIRRDIARTFPAHDFFKDKEGVGQEVLFNVIKAFSIYDTEVGYCQGSPFIVGILLMYMPEEEAFHLFLQLMRDYHLRDLFRPSMADLPLRLYQLDRLIAQHFPILSKHFQQLSLDPSMFASQWFLTLFANSLPLDLVFRVFDVFLLEGLPIIFRVSLTILGYLHNDLLRSNFETCMHILTKDLETRFECIDDFIQATNAISLNMKHLTKLEKDYNVMKEQEKKEDSEFGQLKKRCAILDKEKAELEKQVADLDEENRRLADKLLRLSVDLHGQVDEIDHLKRQVRRLTSTSESIGSQNSETSSIQDGIDTQ